MSDANVSARKRNHRHDDAIDVAPEELIYQLLLQDVEDFGESLKGKQHEGQTTDFEVALSVYQDNILAASDQKMAASIAEALQSDDTLIQAHEAMELQTRYDRAVALYMDSHPADDVGAAPSKIPQSTPEPTVDEHLLRTLESLNIFSDASAGGVSSSWAASRDPSRGPDRGPIEVQTCISCTDTAPVSVMYKAKEAESGTTDRTYCHKPRCSNFVPPQFIKGDEAICVKCGSKTCTLCKKADHTGESCPPDENIAMFKELAEKQGWQQREKCNRTVKLASGCYHMTCVCKHQFCYVCGVEWKKCPCHQWDEQALLGRAEEVVNRERAIRRLTIVEQRRLIVE
ncbi:uncharacterized protein J7T54_001845 [Emericellopsis cladophorae]|uniref:IBR domain-containing protein n=1 Tax=Emericellopsis cladophorae TaxID=2686198 RepID=A0A9P9Y5L6_9HYPO|nr:uncharacterized protein J7T54_001845 [Emericellopsis cladophorae]KAI6783969.1 hypothetical protein J7T54_001845 [Emericellopsis cladophorae]